MLDEAQKTKIRDQVAQQREQLMDGLAPAYLGRLCPLIAEECKGPACQWFALTNGDNGKVSGGFCAVAFGFSQLTQLGDGLMQIANANKPTSAIIK